MFTNVVGLLLGNHTHAGVTSSNLPTEMYRVVAAGHCYCVEQALNLEQLWQRFLLVPLEPHDVNPDAYLLPSKEKR